MWSRRGNCGGILDKLSFIDCIKMDKGACQVKEKPVYTIEREFLGNISTTTLLVRMIRKHLVNDRENGEITYGEKREKRKSI